MAGTVLYLTSCRKEERELICCCLVFNHYIKLEREMVVKRKRSPKTSPSKNRITGNTSGNGDVSHTKQSSVRSCIEIPQLQQGIAHFWLTGDSPLLVNNKLSVAHAIAEQYGKGKGKVAKSVKRTPEEEYAGCFYVMPDSKYPAPHAKASYGIPTSGIKKCACSAIRASGITDNTTVGLISKSFFVASDGGGLCKLEYKKLTRDERPVNIGSGVKTVPAMRYRPMFTDWRIRLRIKFNQMVLSEEQLINLFMYAGAYIGLCEMRAEKKQGECGSFFPEGLSPQDMRKG